MTKFERLTLYGTAIVTLLGLVGLIVTTVLGHASIQAQEKGLTAQREQLHEARQQFRKSGSVIEVTNVHVWLRDQRNGKSIHVESPKRIKIEDLLYKDIYLRFDAANTGRTSGGIAAIGVSTGDNWEDFQPSSAPRCSGAKCSMPKSIDPGQGIQFEFLITSEMREELTCNAFVERISGLTAEVRTTDGQGTYAGSSVLVPFSNDCPPGKSLQPSPSASK